MHEQGPFQPLHDASLLGFEIARHTMRSPRPLSPGQPVEIGAEMSQPQRGRHRLEPDRRRGMAARAAACALQPVQTHELQMKRLPCGETGAEDTIL